MDNDILIMMVNNLLGVNSVKVSHVVGLLFEFLFAKNTAELRLLLALDLKMALQAALGQVVFSTKVANIGLVFFVLGRINSWSWD